MHKKVQKHAKETEEAKYNSREKTQTKLAKEGGSEQVRVLKLMKIHSYLNVPPCIICTPCIIWFRHGTCRIFGL